LEKYQIRREGSEGVGLVDEEPDGAGGGPRDV
jgi:hypothetical protein